MLLCFVCLSVHVLLGLESCFQEPEADAETEVVFFLSFFRDLLAKKGKRYVRAC